MAANAPRPTPVIPGSFEALSHVAEHASLACMVNAREQDVIDATRAADREEAALLDALDAWIDAAARDGGFAAREAREGHALVTALRCLDARENARHEAIDAHNRHERSHEAAASRAVDTALLYVEAKVHGRQRDEVLAFLRCDPPAQLRLIGEEE